MPSRKLITLHAPMAPAVAQELLKPATDLAERFGFKWWYGTDHLPDVALMIEVPPVWCERAPTAKELARFAELWDAGQVSAARALAQTGLPEGER